MNILDIIDNFINNIGVAAGGLLEALLLGWFFDIEGLNTIDLIRNGYGEYSNTDVFIFGWCTIFIVAIGAIVLSKLKGRPGYDDLDKAAAKEV